MPEVSLAELRACGVLDFGDGYRTKRSEHGQPGFRILRVADVADGSVRPTGPDFVSTVHARAIGSKLSQPGDVLLTTKGTVGRVAIYPNDAEQVVYSPQLCYFRVLDKTILHPRLLAYWFKSGAFLEQAAHRANNTDMAAYINLRDIASLTLDLPDASKQLAIAEALGALDDKIAANAFTAEAAETVMLAVARQATGRTSLGSLAVHRTTSLKPDAFDDPVDHYSLPAFDSGALPERATSDSVQSNKFLLRGPSVLIAKLNPRIPRIWNIPALGSYMSVASTEFVVVEPDDCSTSALWAAVSQPDFSTQLQGKVAGTSGSHQRVRPAEMLAVDVLDPRTLAATDRALLDDLGRSVALVRAESARLAATRDELLPLLISGRVTVRDAEVAAEAVT